MSTELFNEYFKYVRTFEEKYGSKTLIMMQVGSFYELYEYRYNGEKIEEDGLAVIGKCTEICKIVQEDPDVGQELKRTKKNSKKPHCNNNPYLVGIPCISYEKWKNIFVTRGYTIVRIDQTDKKGGKRKERKIAEIVTIGTLQEDNDIERGIMCIVCETFNKGVIYGVSSVDIINGKCKVCEYISLSDVEKYITKECIKEIIVYSLNNSIPNFNFNYTSYSFDKECNKIAYQEAVLRKIFKLQSNLEPFDELNLGQSRYATTSLVCLLQYLYEHHELFVTKLQRPLVNIEKERMYIPNNTIYHLNLISNNQLQLNTHNSHINSVLSIIDNTSTTMGKKILKERLLQPFVNPKNIQHYYECIEEMMQLDGIKINGIQNLEKLHRMILLHTLPCEKIKCVLTSYIISARLMNYINSQKTTHLKKVLLPSFHKKQFAELIKYLQKTFDFSHEFLFKKGFNIKYDELVQDFLETVNILQSKVVKGESSVEIIDSMYRLITTKTKAKKLYSEYTAREVKGGKIHVYNEEMYTCGEKAYQRRCAIDEMNKLLYKDALQHIQQSFEKTLYALVHSVAELDYIYNGVTIVKKYKYHKPTIVHNEISFFDVKEIRHPIIERIINEEYITNDLILHKNGMLLYGPNSIGKTSLTKAIGCSIILAQMGYYTPSKLIYSPYVNILTRLSGNDNLFRHQSSFVLEMMELREILNNTSCNSLILGDELCRGTESLSGTALTISTILTLLQKKCTFIFSTHMHHLSSSQRLLPFIEKNELLVRHLHIYYDLQLQTLIYDRKLKEGSGDSRYGIEIAQSLNMDESFMEVAKQIRKELDGQHSTIVSTKQSRYNSKLYVDECIQCKNTKDLHTHHLKEQHLADELGYINSTPKNTMSNIVIVCKKCHFTFHMNNIQLKKLRSTRGLILISKN